jgi:hypothetical protein
LSLGGLSAAKAQGGSTTNGAATFTGSCATSTYGVVTGDAQIFYAPEQFSTVTNAVLRAGSSFLVCTDINLAGWTAFKITPQTQILFAPAGTFLGFGNRGAFGNQVLGNNQNSNQVANNRSNQQNSFGNQNTVGGIGGTNQNGIGNQGNANNSQGNFGNNNQGTANNSQSNFGNNNQGNANNSQGNFGNNQGTANNSQGNFGNNNQGTANNSQGNFGNNQGNLINRGIGQNGNFGSQIGVNRSIPVGTIGVCSNSSNYFMVLRNAEISFAPQANAGTGQFLRPGSVFSVCGDSNINGWIAFKLTPLSQVYFVPTGTFG